MLISNNLLQMQIYSFQQTWFVLHITYPTALCLFTANSRKMKITYLWSISFTLEIFPFDPNNVNTVQYMKKKQEFLHKC
jgi:hypothetical protein